jgi:hypothetical protein
VKHRAIDENRKPWQITSAALERYLKGKEKGR